MGFVASKQQHPVVIEEMKLHKRNTTSLRYMVYAGKVRSWTNLETLGNLLYTSIAAQKKQGDQRQSLLETGELADKDGQ